MRKLIFTFLLIFNTALICSDTPDEFPFRDSSLEIEKRIDDLLNRLTLEEKVAQIMNETPAINRLGIPPYDWWNECLHGVARAGRATVFPQAIALAATFDDNAVFETFDIISDEARAKYHYYQKNKEYDRYKGLTFWTPNINIFRDPRWGRGMETYGEDPYLTGRMGVAAVKGIQGDDPKYFKAHACAKHYAVHSGPEWNRHEFNTSVSPRDLRETYLYAFEDLVKEANVREIMCAYNRLDGSPCCGNKQLLVDILRNEWKYDGIVVSDCGAIDDFWVKDSKTKRHESHKDVNDASIDAIRSGTDLECGQSYKAILEAIRSGKMSEKELDISLRRLLRGKFELGMFDNDNNVKWSKISYAVLDSEKHKQKALEMARKSLVLLKNSNKTLPLSKTNSKVAVVGPNANDSVMLWANYNGFPSSTTTILQGITDKLSSTNVIYEKGCELASEYIIEDLSDAISFNGKRGFEVKYYDGVGLKGKPLQTEMVRSIQYTTTGNTQFAGNVPLTNFSAVFSGDFKAPDSGKITFSITGDDGYRLYIDDAMVLEDWTTHSATTKSVTQDVKKGKVYKLKIEYFQGDGDGQLAFSIGEKKLVDFSKTLERVKDADVIVFVGGISPMLEGEEMPVDVDGFRKGDRTNIDLPAVQKRLLVELKKLNKPLVFVLCSGSAIELNWADENADAILSAWYGGQAAGSAVADVLFGDYNPAGRLPITFYKSITQLGDFEDYAMQGRTYRYMQQSPLYPFGHGLSYTAFEYKDVALSQNSMKVGESVDLNINLKNIGSHNGDEVVQVYVKNKADKNGPIKSLRAFKRVNVPSGSSLKVSINLPSKAFSSYYDDTEHMDVRSGEYSVFVGSSSSDENLVELPFSIK